MATSIVLSHFQTSPLLEARKHNLKKTEISFDLGLTLSEAQIEERGALFLDLPLVEWEKLEEIDDHDVGCFLIDSAGIWKIQLFSETMNRVYSLMPTAGPPTMLLSGLPMHRIKGIDPGKDTRAKLATIRPVTGLVLDTATGLGYTAIEAAKTAEKVITVEIDPTVYEICRCNPWSRRLFEDPKIERLTGDIYDVIGDFDDSVFSRIIHDPPTFSLAGHLYATDFYRDLYRVLRPDGRLFHYIGDLTSRSGKRTSRGVVQRLKEAGFTRVRSRREAFGVVAS